VPPAIRRRRLLLAIANHSVAIALSIAFLVPFAFILATALMTNQQALTAKVWPDPFRWSNFAEVFRAFPFVRYTLNTVTYAVLATVFVRLGWIGSLKPLIIPLFFGDAFSIFLLRQFFLTIPQELSDAARVDGASDLQILTRVIVPLAKPAIAAVALFQFLYSWNDFFNPLLYAGNNPDSWTLAVALTQLTTLSRGVLWNLQMAGALLFTIPVLIVFFFAQKVFVEGVTLTGVKG
jgi:multiple sugar transport system permease protein